MVGCLWVDALSLQHQREIEHCIDVVGRNHKRLAQALDGGFGTPLIIQQVGEIVPSLGKCRISARSSPQGGFGFDGPAQRPEARSRD